MVVLIVFLELPISLCRSIIRILAYIHLVIGSYLHRSLVPLKSCLFFWTCLTTITRSNLHSITFVLLRLVLLSFVGVKIAANGTDPRRLEAAVRVQITDPLTLIPSVHAAIASSVYVQGLVLLAISVACRLSTCCTAVPLWIGW